MNSKVHLNRKPDRFFKQMQYKWTIIVNNGYFIGYICDMMAKCFRGGPDDSFWIKICINGTNLLSWSHLTIVTNLVATCDRDRNGDKSWSLLAHGQCGWVSQGEIVQHNVLWELSYIAFSYGEGSKGGYYNWDAQKSVKLRFRGPSYEHFWYLVDTKVKEKMIGYRLFWLPKCAHINTMSIRSYNRSTVEFQLNVGSVDWKELRLMASELIQLTLFSLVVLKVSSSSLQQYKFWSKD